jgi:hypothetical protein
MTLKTMIPFLDEEEVDELTEKIAASPDGEFQGVRMDEVLPFASEEGVDRMMLSLAKIGKNVAPCFPFASDEGLSQLVELIAKGDAKGIALEELLPFIDGDDVGKLAEKILEDGSEYSKIPLSKLFPFMDDDLIDKIFIQKVQRNDSQAFELAPFASKGAFHELVKRYLAGDLRDFDLDAFYPFMDGDDIKSVFKKVLSEQK